MVGTLTFPLVQDNFEKYCPGLAGTIKFPPVQGYLRLYRELRELETWSYRESSKSITGHQNPLEAIGVKESHWGHRET